MKLDDRDEALGAVLDRSFEGVGRTTAPDPTSVMRRGTRRRASVVLASLTTVAVFVSAVGFAATQLGRDAGLQPATVEGWRTLSAPDIPWTMPIPPGWRAGASRFVGGPRHMIQDMRSSFVTNSPSGTPRDPSAFGGPFRQGASPNAVAVMVDPFVGQGDSRPRTLAFNKMREIPGTNGWTSRDGKICSEWGCVRVYLEYGPDASEEDLTMATRVAEGVKPEVVAPSSATLAPTIHYEDGDLEFGFAMDYPSGWTVADPWLAEGVLEPTEIVTVGSFPLRPGSRTREGFKAVLPSALDDMGPDDVLITIQEYRRRILNAAWRPARFSSTTVCAAAACVDGLALGFEGLHAWWITFLDPSSGRAFSVLVAMGDTAFEDPARSDAAWEVLNSLEFDRNGEPLTSPTPAVTVTDYFDRFDGSRVWPLSGPAEAGVPYRFEVGHCGLSHVTDFDGSFWRPILANPFRADEPSALINDDRGTIRVIGSRQAIYTSSEGEKVSLRRIDGPIELGGCL